MDETRKVYTEIMSKLYDEGNLDYIQIPSLFKQDDKYVHREKKDVGRPKGFKTGDGAGFYIKKYAAEELMRLYWEGYPYNAIKQVTPYNIERRTLIAIVNYYGYEYESNPDKRIKKST